jgi:hypothetical protein
LSPRNSADNQCEEWTIFQCFRVSCSFHVCFRQLSLQPLKRP